MGQACLRDKGQAQDPASHKGVAGETVAGGEKVFHYGKTVKGIGAEPLTVAFQIDQGGFKVAR